MKSETNIERNQQNIKPNRSSTPLIAVEVVHPHTVDSSGLNGHTTPSPSTFTGQRGIAEKTRITVQTEIIKRVAPGSLKPNPLNAALYGTEPVDPALTKSVKENGIQVPLIVTPNNLVIAGHRRLSVALELKLADVPVIVRSFSDSLSEEAALVENNRQRVKTNEMLGNEGLKFVEIEKMRAKLRQKEGGLRKGAEKPADLGKPGAVREHLGELLGVSGPTAQRLVETTKAVQELVKEGKNDEAKQLRNALNKSVNGGYQLGKKMDCITGGSPKKASPGKTPSQPAVVPPEVVNPGPTAKAATPKVSPLSPYAAEDDYSEIESVPMFLMALRQGVSFLNDYGGEMSIVEVNRCEVVFKDLKRAIRNFGVDVD